MNNDLRFALRTIATHRWFSAAVIVTLALGIGINTTVFTLVNAVLFKPLPIPAGERLVTVAQRNLKNPGDFFGVSLPEFRAVKGNSRSFDGLEAFEGGQAVLSEQRNPPERFRMGRITSGLFGMLSTPPVLGRGFTAEDGRAGAEPVALIGYGVWQTRYGGSRDVIGRAVRINGQPATIIGVMPTGFKFPLNEEVWTPLVPTDELEQRSNRSLQVFGLLKGGVSLDEARADLAVIAQQQVISFPDTNQDLGAVVRTFHETYTAGGVRALFLMMLAAVGFVLLIACANVANLMLSRAIARSREIAVRAAMGATRWQLIRQLLVESVLLSCLGGLLGLGFAVAGVHAFDLATRDVVKVYWIVFEMDYVAFFYFAAVSVLSGIVFGVVPAWRASRVDLNSVLKDGTPSGGSRRGGKLTAALVVLQFALTVVLLAGAGMMIRSFFAVQAINPFVRAESVLTVRLQLPEGKGERYETSASRLEFLDRLLPKLATLPGVAYAAATSNFPGLGSGSRDIEIEGKPNENPEHLPRALTIVQTPGYLTAIGQSILIGRGFNEADGLPGREAAVVTREFALKYWPNSPAVDQRFRFIQNKRPGPWMIVIGVCADIVQIVKADETPPPLVYIPQRQEALGGMGLLLRTAADPITLSAPVRTTVQALDPDLALFDVRPLTAALERQWWYLNVFGTLFVAFAVTALAMASVGIYAVVAQTTARRTREIGIRMALGSTAGGILRLVLSRGMMQLGLGLVLGLAGAVGATRVMKAVGFVVQVSPNDPLMFISTALLLSGIGIFACWLPARRAARVNPVEALRAE
jgi:putative ABC transport system permease protein